MNILRRQTRQEQVKEVATGVTSKLLDGSYSPLEILFINEVIKANSIEYTETEIRKNKISEHKIKKQEKELYNVLSKLNE